MYLRIKSLILKVIIEPKLSMLSIRLAENGNFTLKSKDGEVRRGMDSDSASAVF
jgi:hypothetical protein